MGIYNKPVERAKDGSFPRWLGINAAGKRVKFRLSKNLSQQDAEQRIRQIEALWADVIRATKRPDSPNQSFDDAWGPPTWDDGRLELARQIERGAAPRLARERDLCESPAEYAGRIARLSSVLETKVEAHDAPDAHQGLQALRETVHKTNEKIGRLAGAEGKKLVGQMLYEAFEAYKKWIEETCVDGGRTSDGGMTRKRLTKTLTSYLPNKDLGQLDFDGCDALFNVFRNRPMKKFAKKPEPMAKKSCENCVIELGQFFKWLHKSKDWRWRFPEDYPLISHKVRDLDDDCEGLEVETWDLDELITLYQYATPLERIFLLLGLNCSYGADQSGRLKVRQCKLSDKPGHSMIRRFRRKKKTKSIHRLWGMTEKAIRWAIARRPNDAATDHLLLTDEGTPYWRPTKGNNRCQDIPNLWRRLLARVRKDFPTFRQLPFNSFAIAQDFRTPTGAG